MSHDHKHDGDGDGDGAVRPPTTLTDHTAVEQLGPNEFVSKYNPGRFGNVPNIAYGGCTSGIATRAACATVPDGYFCYSVLGTFLGPSATDAQLHVSVERTRDTKTFATRRVLVKQTRADGSTRACLDMLADFHVREPALLTFSPPPSIDLRREGPRASPTRAELTQQAVDAGRIAGDDPQAVFANATMFQAHETNFEARIVASGMAGQNLYGILSRTPTTQDDRHPTERFSGDWGRAKCALGDAGERAAALVFLLDGALSFTPLAHHHLWFGDAGANSTLDFAVRWLVPDADLTKWHLRERRTIAGGHGRSLNESRLWDEDGTLVATATQQCILRPKPQPKAAQAKDHKL